ncbi:MAG: hypothetical protein HOJ22_06255 [Chloroflexi bacterium]|jgi:hypothetical protein|nr:hypothetical protein [Chloroflexota bacterium]MBT5627876.1 hypothetical protein [Chloroflexota bacterium]
MPNQDGSLTGSDKVTLVHMLNRIIPADSPNLGAGTLGILGSVQERAGAEKSTQSHFLRIVDALSLDMMAQAVGGFAALTPDEQIASLQIVENTLPTEFKTVLGLARDVYYEDERTPNRPKNFENENEIFGKIELEEITAEKSPPRRRRRNLRSK